MALRNILEEGDELLLKKSRPVEVIDEKIQTLVDDMIETMHDADGVGLAAPQIGVLKRIIVIDVGAGPMELINPEIIEKSEETTYESEGCLSLPGVWGKVTRPYKIRVKYQTREGDEIEIDATEWMARVICHETDHLDGILIRSKIEEYDD